ncbi:MAG: hypothetical protein HC788_05830 [Sphingopyxis sp.]|nr:hypothetical protein [Sphingopyxis sp.]
MTKVLISDTDFGVRCQTATGERPRCSAVEADRASEPTTSASWNRKNFEQRLLQYDAYVAGGIYSQHLKLTAPLLVLNVLSDAKRVEWMLPLVARRYLLGNSFMLFQAWEEFGAVIRPPEPKPTCWNVYGQCDGGSILLRCNMTGGLAERNIMAKDFFNNLTQQNVAERQF